MRLEEFLHEVTENILDYLPEEYRDDDAALMERVKDEGEVLHGLCIRKAGQEVAPIIYLEPYFNELQIDESKDLYMIMGEIAGAFEKASRDAKAIAMPDISKESIKSKVLPRLSNTITNAMQLENLVSNRMDTGFSVTAYISIDTPEGEGVIQITKEMAESLGYDENELIADAMANAQRLQPAYLSDLENSLLETFNPAGRSEENNLLNRDPNEVDSGRIYVLTTTSNQFGAIALLYPEIEKKLAGITDGNYFVLPSSKHEVLILPDNGLYDLGELAETVRSVNSMQVAPVDRLGDKVLYYNTDLEKMIVAADLDREPVREEAR